MDTDDLVLFLDGPKYKIFFGKGTPFAAPSDRISLERVTEILGVHLIKQGLKIEILTLWGELELALQWESFKRQFSLSLTHKRSA
jgi:hypothetical protein